MKVTIPEKADELTLGQYQQIMGIDDNVDEEFYMRRILSIVYDIKGVNPRHIKGGDIDVMMEAVKTCLNEKHKLQNRFTLNDVEYGFVPNLDDITFGEFVDLDKYSKPEDYHKLMSILFRPVISKQGGRYEIKPYSGSGDLSDMPLGIALGAVSFFLTLGYQLTNATLNSLTEEEIAAAQKQVMQKNGGGSIPSIHSQMETLKKLIQSQN